MEKTKKKLFQDFLVDNALLLVMAIIIISLIVIQPAFLSLANAMNILSQTSTKMIAALGVAGLIVLAGTDLSAGRIIGLCAVVSASLLQKADASSKYFGNLGEMNLLVGLLAAMVIGAILGTFNGFGVAKLKLHAFIATLGTQLIAYGLIQAYINANPNGPQPIGQLSKPYSDFVNAKVPFFGAQFPLLALYALVVVAIMWVVWNKTELGKNMFAIGGNPEAAAVSGINVDKNIIIIFMIAGICYGISGFLEAARIGTVNTLTGTNYDLDAISACVIGGVSFAGGIGKISGVVLGSLILNIITYGLVFLGIPQFWQDVIKGALILIAVALDTRKYLKKS